MFVKSIINNPKNLFEELSNSIKFEQIIKGRKGAVLVDCKNDLVPIVRTTNNYNEPAQKFLPIHYEIINNIKKEYSLPELEFNNALIEIYDSSYCNMGYHSDQALDLANNSYICIFSCYDKPTDIRKLQIKTKATDECFEILLEHNSIILFSLPVNSYHLHKIVLEKNTSNNKWLGITFRLSKTYVKFVDGLPYIGNKILRLANDEEKKEYYKQRSKENKLIDHSYPEIDYTISVSDMLPVQ